MALVVEDGTGKADADSYVSLAAAESYHVKYGNLAWADAESADRETALRKATRYLDSHYGFAGIKTNAAQALQWPRSGVTIDGRNQAANELPAALLSATCEAAFLALSQDLTPALSRGGKVKSEQVDVIAVVYEDAAPVGTVFTLLDGLMRSISRSSSGIKVERS